MSVISIESSGTSVRFGNADGTFFFIESINIISNQAYGGRVYIDYEGSGSVVINYDDVVSPVTASPEDLSQSIQQIIDATKEGGGDTGAQTEVFVRQASDLAGALDSDKLYRIDVPVLDMGSQSIEVPAGGLQIAGYGFGLNTIQSSQGSFSLFTSPVGGSGDLLLRGLSISVNGASSQVYDLIDVDGTHAIEVETVNFLNCSSLGEWTDYRQGLETNTARFGGTPELTLSGAMGGFRITTSIVRGISDITALFKTGTGLSFSSRFLTDINCDLPTSGALFDFAPSNFINDETLIVQGASITRDGVTNSMDTSIYPNINESSVKSKWKDNTGLPNTIKYIKGISSTSVTTPITVIGDYEVLLGGINIQRQSHFDSPNNGEYRLLSGAGVFEPTGTIILESQQNNTVSLRVTKSEDDGVTFSEVIEEIRRTVNNLQGGRDVAIFNLDFLVDMNKNDRLRLEVANQSTTNNITQEIDSTFIVTSA